MEDIATWPGQQLDEDERFARAVTKGTGSWTEAEWVSRGSFVAFASFSSDDECVAAQAFPLELLAPVGASIADHIARHDPARVLREAAAKRRIVELHTTGSWRTYQCSNADHIQDWQCERAKEPYVKHRYCEVCGHDCVELPLLAEIYANRPGFKPEWAAQ